MNTTVIRKAQKAFTGVSEILAVENENDVDELRMREKALALFNELREQASDVHEMSLEEINAEIKAAREEKRMKKCLVTQ